MIGKISKARNPGLLEELQPTNIAQYRNHTVEPTKSTPVKEKIQYPHLSTPTYLPPPSRPTTPCPEPLPASQNPPPSPAATPSPPKSSASPPNPPPAKPATSPKNPGSANSMRFNNSSNLLNTSEKTSRRIPLIGCARCQKTIFKRSLRTSGRGGWRRRMRVLGRGWSRC